VAVSRCTSSITLLAAAAPAATVRQNSFCCDKSHLFEKVSIEKVSASTLHSKMRVLCFQRLSVVVATILVRGYVTDAQDISGDGSDNAGKCGLCLGTVDVCLSSGCENRDHGRGWGRGGHEHLQMPVLGTFLCHSMR